MRAGAQGTEKRRVSLWLPEPVYREMLSRYLSFSFWIGILFIGLYLTLSMMASKVIFRPPLFTTLVALIGIGLAMHLNRRGYTRSASWTYFSTIFLTLLVAMSYIGGPFSVISLTLLVNLSLIAILEGRRGVLIATPIVILGVLLLAYAIHVGIVHPRALGESATDLVAVWVNLSILLINIAMELYMLLRFAGIVESALWEASERERALNEVRQQAEALARSERALREEQSAYAERLNQLIDTYIAFMQRLRMGDDEVRLDLPEQGLGEGEDDPVLRLGYEMSATAESWRQMLARARQARDHYLLTAWNRFLEEQRWQDTAFRLSGDFVSRVEAEHVEVASPGEKPRVEGGTLYLPLRMGALSLGTLLLRRSDGHPWTEDELETLQDIIPPLVQTLDNLRLVEESRNRAAREQLTSRIADRMRESLDLEIVLRTAAQELGDAFGLREVIVQLAPSQQSSEGRSSS